MRTSGSSSATQPDFEASLGLCLKNKFINETNQLAPEVVKLLENFSCFFFAIDRSIYFLNTLYFLYFIIASKGDYNLNSRKCLFQSRLCVSHVAHACISVFDVLIPIAYQVEHNRLCDEDTTGSLRGFVFLLQSLVEPGLQSSTN